MSRSRKLTPLRQYNWEQLDQIERDYYLRTPEEARSRWQHLWQRTVAGDKLSTADLHDAELVLSKGWSLAMAEGDYDTAVQLLRAYFAHPQIDEADSVSVTALRCNLATALLCRGDESGALGIYYSLLETPERKTARQSLFEIRSDLLHFCSHSARDERASGAVADLVEEMVNRFMRRVPRKKRLPENATYADLQWLLDSTFPAEDRDALRREREHRNDSSDG